MYKWADEMTQWVKLLVNKSEDLNVIFETHIKERTEFFQLSSDLCRSALCGYHF